MKRRIDLVDLSHYQSNINIHWPDAKKAGLKGVYHKATEGTGWTDSAFAARRKEARDNGVPFGAYHFARPEVGNAKAEAEHFLKTADPQPGDLRPALDLEVNDHRLSIDQLTVWVHTWFETVFAHIGVRRGVLYTHFNLTRRPHGVLLWVARYSDSNSAPVVPKPFWTWSIWQFSDGHFGDPQAVPGIGRVDIDTIHWRFRWARLGSLRLPEPHRRLSRAYRLNPDHYPSATHPHRHAHGHQITWLGTRLVAHGFGQHYKTGPGPNWGPADRENVRAFQKAQGWTGADANGFVGKETLRRLAAKPKARRKTKPSNPVQPVVFEDPIARMVRIAQSQVGYHEGRSGGHWNNHQKYSPAVPGLEWSQNQPWCATFVSWLAMKAGLADYFPRTASTDTGAAWFKQRGQWSEYPAIGAQVFYGRSGNMEHTGFVYAYDDTYVYAIEGNTNTNGSAEGDGVYRKKRVRRDSYVQGYGYPNIPNVRLKSADPKYNTRSA